MRAEGALGTFSIGLIFLFMNAKQFARQRASDTAAFLIVLAGMVCP